jgi:hypothetical protein
MDWNKMKQGTKVMTNKQWNKRTEVIKRRYAKRILAKLTAIQTLLRAEGHITDEPAESCDDYRWSLLVDADKKMQNGIDITIQICESPEYDGTFAGITFRLDIVEFGGRILGEFSPYNWTEQVWVSITDREAIETRFRLLEDANISTIPDLIANP